jgi:hypothetical protein
MSNDEILMLAGELAVAARNVVGGTNLALGTDVRPANIFDTKKFNALKNALDAYDNVVLAEFYERKKPRG